MQFESLRDLRMKGFGKFMHALVMFITYPLRHFFKFLLLLLFLLLVFLVVFPLTQKVAVKDIPQFYQKQYEEIWLPKLKGIKAKITSKDEVKTQKMPKAFSKKAPSQVQDLKKVEAAKEPQKEAAKNEHITQKYEVWHIQKKETLSQPQKFKKAFEPIKEPATEKKEVQPAPKRITEIAIPRLTYQKVDGLTYFNQPRVVEGTAIVYGPNELYVDDTYMYLYGIYTNEYQYDLRAASDYLRKLIGNQSIRCYVIAQTKDDIATAICFNGNQNINQEMVDAHLADDVALSTTEN